MYWEWPARHMFHQFRSCLQSSRLTLKYMIKMLAHVMEMIVFIFLGISSISNEQVWNWPFVFLTILFCTVFR